MNLRFRKHYADLVAADGTVCVAYASRLRLGRRTLVLGGVELYRPDGRREVLRTGRGAGGASVRRAAGGLELRLALREGPFVLRLEPEAGRWEPPAPAPAPGLTWSVDVPRGRASARWPSAAGPGLVGLGYADRVEIRGLPRRMHLQELFWGRCHLPDETVAFTELHRRRRPVWRRAAVWRHGRDGPPREWDDFSLVPRRSAIRLMLPRRGSSPVGLVVEVADVRGLHAGSALDTGRFPSIAERLLTGALAGRVLQERRLGQAAARGGASAAGWTIHERVGFGRDRGARRAE